VKPGSLSFVIRYRWFFTVRLVVRPYSCDIGT
jgi:hypothetical protein